MTIEEIRSTCINSAKVYYQYLDENNRGIQEVDVYSINKVGKSDNYFKLKLSKKLFDLDALLFHFLTINKKYTTEEIKVVQYDRDANNLIVQPCESLKTAFARLQKQDLKLISDLKFLVERVKNWYEQNGSKVKIPKNPSILANDWEQLDFFPGLHPSENQRKALETIFTKPFSYIWGAPGTGKTQIVLSYALLHYIKKGKNVAIFGPTNNAIEQVLKGVIGMTDKADIDREKIIRLGSPSKKFAEAFPEVCEAKGIEKQLRQINQQIKILEDILQAKEEEIALNGAKSSLGLFNELAELKLRSKDIQQQLIIDSKALQQLSTEQKKLNKLKEVVKWKLTKLESKKRGIGHKIRKYFVRKETKTESVILEKQKELEVILQLIKVGQSKVKDQEKKYQKLKKAQAKCKSDINTCISAIQQVNSLCNHNILNDLSIGNFALKKIELEEWLKTAFDQLEVTQSLANEYSAYPLETVRNRIDILKDEKEAIAGRSTEERLKEVHVIASTLDCYIGRYLDTKLGVDHIFLDEAGYANMIKTLTLFNHDVPITLLGDHKQLPPVCEIGNYQIEREQKYRDVFIWSQSSIYIEGLFLMSKENLLRQYLRNEPFTRKEMTQAKINESFRFGENLARVLENHVYKNGFKSANLEGETTIFYLNAPFDGHRRKKRENYNEAVAVEQLVSNYEILDYVILTPYRNQLMLIGERLPQARNDQKILTVHGSQGKEWETVILSISDTNNMWFVDSNNTMASGLNLMNTAVSRAKKHLVIVCDYNFWKFQNGQLIKGLLDIAQPLELKQTV